MKKVYSIEVRNRTSNFYETRELAQRALKKTRDGVGAFCCKYFLHSDDTYLKMGVAVLEDTPDTFTFLLGWEEVEITYQVKEHDVITE